MYTCMSHTCVCQYIEYFVNHLNAIYFSIGVYLSFNNKSYLVSWSERSM